MFIKYNVSYFSLFFQSKVDFELGKKIQVCTNPNNLLFMEIFKQGNFLDILTDGSKLIEDNFFVGFPVRSTF